MKEKKNSQLPLSKNIILKSLSVIFSVAAIFTVLLIIKSVVDFTHSGPEVQNEVMAHFKIYVVYSLGRLGFWTFVLSSFMALIGILVYYCFAVIFNLQLRWYWAVVACGASIATITFFQFCRHLLYIPSSIVASSLYRNSRFYPLWEQLSPERLSIIQWTLSGLVFILISAAILHLIRLRTWSALAPVFVIPLFAVGVYVWVILPSEAISGIVNSKPAQERMNIVMIGADTLRADRFGAAGYYRQLTPHIDELAKHGTQFTNSFVPLARTAPSLTSLLTGTWPHTHGIRSNYIADEDTDLPVASLPQLLSEAGYRTAAISDWAGADLGKIQFGFDYVDVSDDQWNIKYLIRQGPKDIRLFLSLFTHNRFGKTFLPEIYYLAGIPLGRDIRNNARSLLSEFATGNYPFFLMVFMSNTHLPFGSKYPYYTLYSDRDYNGESKFVMSGLTTPSEIIKKQSQGKNDFDVQQVNNLYDGCLRSFDDEVSRIVNHIKDIGLSHNTIIVIFSDHGLDLFERHTWGQGNSVLGDDPSARIPLIIIDPRRDGGNVVPHVTRSIDVAPTLLELVSLPVHPSIEGVSLVPYIDKQDVDLKLAAYHETGIWLASLPGIKKNHLKYPSLLELLEVPNKQTGTLSLKPEFDDIVIEAKDRMIRTEKWKLVYLPMQEGAIYWLFDMVEDPEARFDVAAQHPDVVESLKHKIVSWMTEDKNRYWRNEHLVVRPSGLSD